MSQQETIAVVGLGYVGLPVATAFARAFPGTIGFDVNERRVAEIKRGEGFEGEAAKAAVDAGQLTVTTDASALKSASFVVVAVPTPIDETRRPDLTPLDRASRTVGANLREGAVVVYESTVYPGVTEEICGPILEEISGLKAGEGFFLGYSPERINPGDTEHTLERIVKVVSGESPEILERVATTYEAIIDAGVHRAPSIKVAEAAKVIENTQRDLNIALMNELALIFDRAGIRTQDVLAAAQTKWNFLPFTPGLVGGHCIGVDPYYLTTKAEALGYHPQVILSGRRINDSMGAYVAEQTVKKLIHAGRAVKGARVGVLGLTFKENVPDIRNSRVPDIVRELEEYGVVPVVHDPLVDPEEAHREYGVTLADEDALSNADALIVAVAHARFLERGAAGVCEKLARPGVLIDVKSIFEPADVPEGVVYWSL
jgi:UDP-N-acetyl-D-galactosamine dehydrogenase